MITCQVTTVYSHHVKCLTVTWRSKKKIEGNKIQCPWQRQLQTEWLPRGQRLMMRWVMVRALLLCKDYSWCMWLQRTRLCQSCRKRKKWRTGLPATGMMTTKAVKRSCPHGSVGSKAVAYNSRQTWGPSIDTSEHVGGLWEVQSHTTPIVKLLE